MGARQRVLKAGLLIFSPQQCDSKDTEAEAAFSPSPRLGANVLLNRSQRCCSSTRKQTPDQRRGEESGGDGGGLICTAELRDSYHTHHLFCRLSTRLQCSRCKTEPGRLMELDYPDAVTAPPGPLAGIRLTAFGRQPDCTPLSLRLSHLDRGPVCR